METDRMIGQHLFAGFAGYQVPADFAACLRKGKIGNIILFAHNVENVPQLAALCQQLRQLVIEATGYEPFIAIDQEGGVVSRLSLDATIMPSAMAISATGNPENAYQAGLITGQELRALGINFNLAPVLDINSNHDNPVIGVRSYGFHADTVIRYALPMMRGLADGGVLSCGKHFPGHGDTAVDSHLGLPLVDKSLDELRQLELSPFHSAIAAGIPAIMSSHILFPQIEPRHVPATMSRTIMTGLLKEQLGFDGLVLSDCMMMGAISDHYGTVPGMVAAIAAGVDLVFASHSIQLAGEAAQAIQQALVKGDINQKEFAQSTQKILRYKEGLSMVLAPMLGIVGCEEHMLTAQGMYEASIQTTGPLPALGERPFFVGCLPYLTTPAVSAVRRPLSFADTLCDALGGSHALMPENPTPEDIASILALVPGHTSLVAGTYNAHLKTGQLRLVQALAGLGLPLVVVALRNPYDLQSLPGNAVGVAAYAYNEPVLAALVRLFKGELTPSRVSIPQSLTE